jgi:hypothetical protein
MYWACNGEEGEILGGVLKYNDLPILMRVIFM